jgi:hypothetical protein
MIEYRNLYWDAPDHSRMQAEIKHPDFGWIPYCCMEGDTGIGAELWAARAYLDVEEWRDRRDLEQTRSEKIVEINSAKNYQLNNGGLEYEEDLFAYDDKALLRISGTILDWQDQISRGAVQPGDIVQPWISKANRVHPLSYDQLIELARLLRQEVQRIVFYGTYLEKLAQAATTLEELDAIVWDYGAASASGVIDRLIAGGNQDA